MNRVPVTLSCQCTWTRVNKHRNVVVSQRLTWQRPQTRIPDHAGKGEVVGEEESEKVLGSAHTYNTREERMQLQVKRLPRRSGGGGNGGLDCEDGDGEGGSW